MADAARGNLVETVNPSVPVGYGSPAGLGMVYRGSDLLTDRAILRVGGAAESLGAGYDLVGLQPTD